MRIAAENGDHDHYDCRDQRPDHRHEFQRAAGRAEHQCVGHAHRSQYRGVDHQRKGGQRQLGANKLRQHLIQIVQHVFQKLALGPGLH